MAEPRPQRDVRGGYRLTRAMRLTARSAFDAVFTDGRRQHAGPLLLYARPNGLAHLRLGLAISRRVGGAVARNRIRRRLREAFRLMQHDLPCGYDLVVSVRRHDPLPLAEYQRLLAKAARHLHLAWTSSAPNNTSIPIPTPPA